MNKKIEQIVFSEAWVRPWSDEKFDKIAEHFNVVSLPLFSDMYPKSQEELNLVVGILQAYIERPDDDSQLIYAWKAYKRMLALYAFKVLTVGLNNYLSTNGLKSPNRKVKQLVLESLDLEVDVECDDRLISELQTIVLTEFGELKAVAEQILDNKQRYIKANQR